VRKGKGAKREIQKLWSSKFMGREGGRENEGTRFIWVSKESYGGPRKKKNRRAGQHNETSNEIVVELFELVRINIPRSEREQGTLGKKGGTQTLDCSRLSAGMGVYTPMARNPGSGSEEK